MFLNLCQDMEELWSFRNSQHFELICPMSTLPDAYKGLVLGFNHVQKKYCVVVVWGRKVPCFFSVIRLGVHIPDPTLPPFTSSVFIKNLSLIRYMSWSLYSHHCQDRLSGLL